jgi:hypothetical protein
MTAKQSSVPVDAAAVFQAYVDLINSERETIWARHNALLVAYSLIVGALAISPAALRQNKWAALSLLGAGVVIGAIWLLITAHGWAVLHRHMEMTSAKAMALASLRYSRRLAARLLRVSSACEAKVSLSCSRARCRSVRSLSTVVRPASPTAPPRLAQASPALRRRRTLIGHASAPFAFLDKSQATPLQAA